MVGHFTMHIRRTFNAASAVLSVRPLAFLLLPVNTSHARGKERKVGQGQMECSAEEASFRSLRLFVCLFSDGFSFFALGEGKSVSKVRKAAVEKEESRMRPK